MSSGSGVAGVIGSGHPARKEAALSEDPRRPATPRREPVRRSAPRQLLAALGFSLSGLGFLLRQRAARFQLAMIGVTAAVFALVGAGPGGWAAMLALGLLSLSVEAVNTAVELIVDRVSPEISDFGKHAKDLGSFAVLCTLTIFAGHALWVVAGALAR